MKTTNLKSTLSTVLGIMGMLGGVALSMPQYGIELPIAIKAIAGSFIAISVGGIGFLTGKNPDGSRKTAEQVEKEGKETKNA